MDKIFETAIFNRKVLQNFINELTHDQLIKIPKNFNNSIFWNITHVLVSHQLLVYRNSGLSLEINPDLISKYAKGSKATTDISREEIDYVKHNLLSTILKTQEDYKKGVFKHYEVYHTSVKIDLNNVEDALKFSAFHEGIHLGVILSIKKLV